MQATQKVREQVPNERKKVTMHATSARDAADASDLSDATAKTPECLALGLRTLRWIGSHAECCSE